LLTEVFSWADAWLGRLYQNRSPEASANERASGDASSLLIVVAGTMVVGIRSLEIEIPCTEIYRRVDVLCRSWHRPLTGDVGSPPPCSHIRFAFGQKKMSASPMRNSTINVLAIVLGVVAVFEYGPAHAAGCPAIEAASIKQATTPYHMTMDRGEMGGSRSELIQTATTTYALIREKWVSIPYDPQERIKDMKESAEDQKIACQSVGHETVDGQRTDHYTAQTTSDEGTSSGDVWISSDTGLIVREHMTLTEDGKKTTRDVRFDYSNVIAPAESTPLQR
jgi:hypothetical protein